MVNARDARQAGSACHLVEARNLIDVPAESIKIAVADILLRWLQRQKRIHRVLLHKNLRIAITDNNLAELVQLIVLRMLGVVADGSIPPLVAEVVRRLMQRLLWWLDLDLLSGRAAVTVLDVDLAAELLVPRVLAGGGDAWRQVHFLGFARCLLSVLLGLMALGSLAQQA